MSLNKALNLFLEEYPKAIKKQFAGNQVADFIRNDVPNILKSIIGNSERYKFYGSAGQGNWARVPWTAIFDKFITESAQDGFYICYLVCEDFSGVYITLNQGVTTIKNIYRTKAKEALRLRAADMLAQIGNIFEDFDIGIINLKVSSDNSLGADYEQGSICSKFYPKNFIPEDKILEGDLKRMMELYFHLSTKQITLKDNKEREDDEQELDYEYLNRIREHKRVERNQKLTKKAKKINGYKCQICNFDFEETYGEVGKGYIEAHHLVPLSLISSQKIALDPKRDFAVLCANCHRIIHRSKFVGDINKFREVHLKKAKINI